jgi:hypothetical protein
MSMVDSWNKGFAQEKGHAAAKNDHGNAHRNVINSGLLGEPAMDGP